MNNHSVLLQIKLSTKHQSTGKTKHFDGEKELPPASILQIVKYPDDQGYYLLYMDEGGNELTDTYHDNLDGAMAQAEWEYLVKPSEWECKP